MAFPEPLADFWSAWRGLTLARRPTAWGEVVSDPRYPLVWESNHAAVLRNHATVSLEEIRAELIPALTEARAVYEHVEFWDPPASCPALEALKVVAEHGGTDAVMVYEGPADGPAAGTPDGLDLEELTDPGEDFWAVYRTSRDEFAESLTDEVVDQLVLRDRELLVPAGLRAFVAKADGDIAGFATLISLAGAGYVDNVVTLLAHRRRGVGTATTAMAIRESLAAGDRMVHLLTEDGSDAQRLYERLGMGARATVSSATRRLPGSSR
jgi:ribosomal protein S18 acetylase RimI-like enzyme